MAQYLSPRPEAVSLYKSLSIYGIVRLAHHYLPRLTAAQSLIRASASGGGRKDECDNEPIQTQCLGEDQNQNHAHEQLPHGGLRWTERGWAEEW